MFKHLLMTSFMFGLGLVAASAVVADIPGQIANDNPIGWWRFEDATSLNGDTATDSAGTNDGTYSGNVSLMTGIAGNSARFDGNLQSVFIGNMGALPTEGSIEMWLYPEVMQDHRNPFTTGPLGGGTNGNQAIRFEAKDSSALVTYIGNGSLPSFSQNLAPIVTVEEWHHLVLTWNVTAGTVDGFFDNQHLIVGAANSVFPAQLSDVRIGMGWANLVERSWLGRIDEVAIYDKQLTAADVNAHFTGVPEPASFGVCSILFAAACLRRKR